MVVLLKIANQLPEGVSFWVEDQFHGNARSRQLWTLQQLRQNMLQLLVAMDKFCGFRISCLIMDENVADLLTKPFDARRFQYLVVEHAMCGFVKGNLIIYTTFVSHTVFGWVIGTSKYWDVLIILMISLRLIPLCLSPKSTGFNEFNSNIATALICLATNRVYNFSKMIFDGRTIHLFPSMLFTMGEGSGTPTEPHHTPSPEAQQTSPTTHSSPTLPPVTIESFPTVTPSNTPQLRKYTRRARIAQSSTLPTAADEPASPLGDGSQGEACPTITGLVAGQDKAIITKTSTLPSDSTPRVTSLAADEGSMQHQIQELTALCTSLQRQHTEMASKIKYQELEITNLKARVKLLEDREGGGIAHSRDDAPIKGRSLDEGEEAAEKGSNDTKEMVNVLTFLDAATVLSSGVAEVPIGSGSIPTAGPPTTGVPTDSEVVPTDSPIFTTAT
nr:hypothetical protein [Tanacetum cinerariifolium]